MPFAVGDITP